MKKSITSFIGWIALFFIMWSPLSAKSKSTNVAWALICPNDVTVDCGAELWDLSIYGTAIYHDHTGYHPAGNPVVTYHLNGCGTGTIKRKWTVEDPYWNWHSCTQTITVGGIGFDPASIEWPGMVTLEGCNPNTHPDVTGKPKWVPSECSMLGTSYKDALYTVSPDCKKILRKWTIIDWCMNNPNHMSTWTYTQTIKIVVSDPPVVNCPKEIVVSAFDCKNGNVVMPPIKADSTKCGGNFEIINNSPYAKEKKNDLSGIYPVGTTKVTFTIKYACGQKKTCTTNVIVKNDKGPVPVCINSLSVALMGIDTDNDGVNDQGMVDIWAKDLNWKSYPTCNQGQLRFAFSKDPNDMKKTFTCDDIGKQKVKMFAIDTKGNAAFCEVEIDVQNNGANIKDCKPKPKVIPQNRFLVKGEVKTQFGQPIKGANLELTSMKDKWSYTIKYDTTQVVKKDSFKNASGYWLWYYDVKKVITSRKDSSLNTQAIMLQSTQDNGLYAFDTVMVKGGSYSFKARDYNASLSNIDKADIDALTNHLLGVKILNNPSHIIAADVDNNGQINIDDLNLLIKYVKGEISSFDKNWVIMTADNKESLLFENVDKDMVNINFIAVQKGDITDVKGNTITDLNNENIEVRNREDFKVNVYPNPFANEFNINFDSNESKDVNIVLYDISGRIVIDRNETIERGASELNIQTDHLENGMYIYHIKTSKSLHSGKISKVK